MYLFLPGNNRENREWCEMLKNSFPAEKKEMVYYDHWNGIGNIVWDTELEKIRKLGIDENSFVVGKSAGCILGMKAQNLNYLRVSRFVFIGFPYYWAKNRGDDVDWLLGNLNVKTLIIQKPHDPVIGFNDLNEIVRVNGLGCIDMLEYRREGEDDNNHDYDDIPYLIERIKEFCEDK